MPVGPDLALKAIFLCIICADLSLEKFGNIWGTQGYFYIEDVMYGGRFSHGEEVVLERRRRSGLGKLFCNKTSVQSTLCSDPTL